VELAEADTGGQVTGFWQFIQGAILIGAVGSIGGGVAGMLIRWEIRALGNALIEIVKNDKKED
jgi:ABC-type lipoprotein release transport system permease subunit